MAAPFTGGPSGLHPVRVASVPAKRPMIVLFLAGLRGIATHWFRGRTALCFGEEKCRAALHETALIWRGYAPVLAYWQEQRLWLPTVLEATAGLEEILRGRELRGEVWRLERQPGKGRARPVLGTFLERRPDDELPAAFNVEPPLLRLYNVPELPDDSINPREPRLFLPSVELPLGNGQASSASSASSGLGADDLARFQEARASMHRDAGDGQGGDGQGGDGPRPDARKRRGARPGRNGPGVE